MMSAKHFDLISRGTRISLNHTTSKLQLYDGTTMGVKGTIDIWCMHKGQEYLMTFHIVDGRDERTVKIFSPSPILTRKN